MSSIIAFDNDVSSSNSYHSRACCSVSTSVSNGSFYFTDNDAIGVSAGPTYGNGRLGIRYTTVFLLPPQPII